MNEYRRPASGFGYMNDRVARAASAMVLGYLLGSVPVADLAARLSNSDADIRAAGSGNPGALNTGKEIGKAWGAVVLALDTGKGLAAAMTGRRLAGPNVANLAASAAVVGHCFPLSGRTGGKGVATSIGQVLGTFPRYLPLDMAVGVATAAMPSLRQRTHTATTVSSTVWVIASAVAWARRSPTGTDSVAPIGLPLAAGLSSLVIASRFASTPLVDGRPAPESAATDRDDRPAEVA